MKTLLTITTLAACCLGAGPVQAGEVATNAMEKAIEAGFSELERQLIGRYYGDRVTGHEQDDDNDDSDSGKGKPGKHDKGMPPGLAKRDELPPGLAKRETLPPGLARRGLPEELERQLPPPPAGYERQVIEDAAVVLVEKATDRVTDIIKDIVIPTRRDRP